MLFVDLDETLIKSFPKYIPAADFHFKYKNKIYSTFIRPDANDLKRLPFVVFTANTCTYASKICSFLKSQGFQIQSFMCRKHLFPFSKSKMVKGYLLDNSKFIASLKINKLPNVKWIKIDPFDYKNSQLQIIKQGFPFKKAIEIAEKDNAIEFANPHLLSIFKC